MMSVVNFIWGGRRVRLLNGGRGPYAPLRTAPAAKGSLGDLT